ncbi:MAG: CPBP family intramembrane metalloprotease [Hydrogenophilaceae bacterium]|nr:CPBP family intramembrane metalloprotease [Hydrogenophilaceae bacterium]
MYRAFLSHRPAIELTLVFLGLPLLAWWQSAVLKRWLIPQILLLALVCLLVLWRDPSFDRRQLRLMPERWRPCLLRIGFLLAVGGLAVLAWAAWAGDIDLFGFPRERPGLWLAVLLLYPPVSALAQEVVFRVFFFHRYRAQFATPGRMIVASALLFSLAHLVLGNWQAPVLALFGGLLFAWTYSRTRSLLLVTLEHGLWGDWLFTVGFGRYFYGGHI